MADADIWIRTLRKFPLDERWMIGFGFVLSFVFGFWIPNLFLWIASKFEWFLKFKIQKVSSWPSEDLVWSALTSNFGALLISQPLIGKPQKNRKKAPTSTHYFDLQFDIVSFCNNKKKFFFSISLFLHYFCIIVQIYCCFCFVDGFVFL